MYCQKCGKKITNENSKFCRFCGAKLIKTDTKTSVGSPSVGDEEQQQRIINEDKNIFEIEIPGISGDTKVRFTKDELSYQNTTIKYQDITGVSCKQIYHSVNLIPTHQEFSFKFYSEDQNININFGTTLHIGAKSRKEIFVKLYSISKEFFVPIIVNKLVLQILKDDKTVNIGGIYFNKHGFYKKKFFGGEEWVHWRDRIGEPGMESGSIIIFKTDGDKYKNFAEISLDTINALAVPDLITAMYTISQENRQ